MKNKEVKIDLEFKTLISPLSEGEFKQLEANIIADGCMDALVAWKEEGILLDGHNRLNICKAHNLEYRVIEISIPDRTAAMVWIIKNQIGKRNLSESQRAMCAARLANLEEGRPKTAQICAVSQEDAGKLFNVSRRSVQNAKAVLEAGAPELVAAVVGDELAVSSAAAIATLPKEDQVDVVNKGKVGILATVKEIKRKKAKQRKAKRSKQKADAVAKNHPLEGDSFRLLHGDIAEAGKDISDNFVDAIITDPPYAEEFIDVYEKLAHLAARVLVNGGHCLVMIGQSHLPKVIANLCIDPGLFYHWTIAYLTPGQSTQVFGRKIKSNWKPIIWLIKGKNNWEHVEDSIESDKNDKQFHEWGQSVGGIAQLIERFTVKKSLILDPFVGGGSTAIAALSLDRMFVGIDKDKACIQETADRISKIVKN